MHRSILSLALLALSAPAVATQGNVSSFCPPGANGATLSAAGSTDFGVNNGSGDLVLKAQGLPTNTVGVLVQGNLQAPRKPLGGGFLCVGGAPQVWRLAAVSTGPSSTSASYALDYLTPAAPAALITPGSTWNFQLWFRDGASSDLTDALQVRFVPPVSLGSGKMLHSTLSTGHPLGKVFQGGALVIGDDAEYQAFWAAHTSIYTPPPPPPPQVDLTQETLIVVLAGRRLTSGYSIAVRDIALDVTSLHVNSLERQPGAGCGVFFSETSPLQMVTVPKIPSAVLKQWTPLTHVYTCP